MTRNEILQFIWEGWPGILMGGYRNKKGADSQELLKNHLNELGDSLIVHLQAFDYDQALRGKLYNIAKKLNDDPSMYKFSPEEYDLLCIYMGWSIEMEVSDFEEIKLQEEMLSEANELCENIKEIRTVEPVLQCDILSQADVDCITKLLKENVSEFAKKYFSSRSNGTDIYEN